MRPATRTLRLTFLIVPSLIFAVAAGIYMARQFRSLEPAIPRILANEMSTALGCELKIGRAEVSARGQAVFHDVRMSEERPSHEPFMTTSKIGVNFDPRKLLSRGASPAAAITRIRISKPTVWVRRNGQGVWNVNRLLARAQREKAISFRGAVVAKGARVILIDEKASRTAVFENISAAADFSAQPLMTFNGHAESSSRVVARFRAAGTRNAESKVLSLAVTARGADVPWWSAYFRKPRWMELTSGVVAGDLGISRVNKKTHATGLLTLSDGAAYLKPVRARARGFSGSLQFAGAGVRLDLTGNVEGAPTRCVGSISVSPPASLDLLCQANNVRPETANKLISGLHLGNVRLLGRSSLQARIRGTLPDVSVEFAGRSGSLAAAGYDARSLEVRGIYRGGIIGLTDARINVLGGMARAQGSIGTKGAKTLNLTGEFLNMRMPSFPGAWPRGKPKAVGVLSGTFKVGENLARPRIGISIADSTASIAGIPVRIRRFAGEWESGQLRVSESMFGVAGGVVTVSGVATASRLDLTAGVEDVAIERIASLADVGAKGVAFAQAKIGGSLDSPQITADVQIYDGEYKNIVLTKAAGRILFSSGRIDLTDWVASSYPTEARFGGHVILRAGLSPRVDINLSLANGRADQIARLLGADITITGVVDGDVRLMGTYPDLGLEGVISFANGVVEGYAVDSANAVLSHAGKEIFLQRFQADSAVGSWYGTGVISLDRRLDLAVSGTGIPLERFNPRVQPYASLRGNVDVSAEIGGTFAAPTLHGHAAGAQLAVNGVEIQSLSGEFVWDGLRFSSPKATMSLDGEYSLENLVYLPQKREIRLGIAIQSAAVNQLVRIFRGSEYARKDPDLTATLRRIPSPTTGQLSLQAAFMSSPSSRSLSGKADLTDAVIGGTEAGTATLDAALVDDELTIRDFKVVGPDLNLSVNGAMTTGGEIHRLDASAYNLNVALIKQIVPLPGIAGQLNLDFTAAGSVESPRLEGSADLSSALIYDRKFDLLSLSRFTVSPDPSNKGLATIELSDIVFATAGFNGGPGLSGRAYGTIPWDWQALNVPKDREMSLNLEATEQSVAALTALAPDVFNAALTSGQFTVDLSAKGTLSQRDLRGVVKLANGTVAMRRITTPLTNLKGELVFEGGKARIASFTGGSAGGGTFSAEGEFDVSTPADAAVRARVVAKDVRLEAENVTGIYDEKIQTTVSTEALTVDGKLRSPMIAGKVALRNSSVRLRAKTEAERKPARKNAFNPSFDIGVSVKDDAWLRNPRLAVKLTGDTAIKGSFNSPEIRGRFQVERGTFLLPTARLMLRPGGTIDVDYAPPAVRRVILALEARSSVYTVSRLGTHQRYEVIMEIGGSPEKPAISVTSVPPGLSESEIVALLGHVGGLTDAGQQALREDISGVLTAMATPFILSPIEAAITEAFGLEEFAIEYGPRQPMAVYFSADLVGNFFTSYRHSIGSLADEYDFKLGYRFGRRLQVTIGMDEQHITTIEVAGTKRF